MKLSKALPLLCVLSFSCAASAQDYWSPDEEETTLSTPQLQDESDIKAACEAAAQAAETKQELIAEYIESCLDDPTLFLMSEE